MNNVSSSQQIIKNLHAVLTYAKERYENEFLWQDVMLDERFKKLFSAYLEKKNNTINFLTHTSVVTNKTGQIIVVPNQWFVLASYFVDFCTELLTYRQYYMKITQSIGIGKDSLKQYTERIRLVSTPLDKAQYIKAAQEIISSEFPNSNDKDRACEYLWKFASDYSWWAGSKTVNRHDFYISALLNQLNVVNANSEFLAEIVFAYASDINLRMMVEEPENFTIGLKTKDYEPSYIESESYDEAEDFVRDDATYNIPRGISISAASLERFHNGTRI